MEPQSAQNRLASGPCYKRNTLHPRYNALPYTAILDTRLFFLGSQIIFKKYLWGSVDVILLFSPTLQLKILDLYKYGRILTKRFSFVEKIRREKHSGD